MDSQGAAHQSHFDFGTMDLAFTMPQQAFNAAGKTSNGGDNTSPAPAFFFADEGIDTTTTTGDAFSQQAFDSIFPEFNMPQSLVSQPILFPRCGLKRRNEWPGFGPCEGNSDIVLLFRDICLSHD